MTSDTSGRGDRAITFLLSPDGEASGWYETNVPIADDRFDEHQERLNAKKASTKKQATTKSRQKKGKGRR